MSENARLTAVTGVVLLLPLLVVTGTGLDFGLLWRVHYFVGFLLLPLVALKLASTGYRAARYHLGSARYRRAGPPAPLLRLLAPILVISAVVLLLSGVVMWLDHRGGGLWSTLHTDAAVVFCGAVAVHLLAHLPAAWRTARAPRPARTGTSANLRAERARLRPGVVLGAAVFGLVLAVASVPGSHRPQRGPEGPHHDAAVVAPQAPAASLTVR